MDCTVLIADDVDLVFGYDHAWLALVYIACIECLGLLSLGKCSGEHILFMKSNPGKPA